MTGRIRHAAVLAADCPWRFGDDLPGPKRGAASHYATLSTRDLCDRRGFPFPPLRADAVLFLWRVAAMVEDAVRVAEAWRFTPKSEIVWVKLRRTTPCRTCGQVAAHHEDVNQPACPRWVEPTDVAAYLHFGMGHTTRAAHETCMIATRGRPDVRVHDVRSVFFAPVGRHSEKPARFYQIVEEMFAGPRVEMFARRRRPNWIGLGDEVDGPAGGAP